MSMCPSCERDYPPHLVTNLEVGYESGVVEERAMCPLCALLWINRVYGLPLTTPFRGKVARLYHTEALRHLKDTGQPV